MSAKPRLRAQCFALLGKTWVRIPRPEIDKLACQAQGVGIFATSEYSSSALYTECFLFLSAKLRLQAQCFALPGKTWVRIPRPKIDKLACQAQGVGIFATSEYSSSAAKKSNSKELDFFICATRHNIICVAHATSFDRQVNIIAAPCGTN
ncbi:MAG: hypothetical protein J6Q85_07215 [Clostridia bacterium]|nr:hypothetical protein [Clostridia bacterium]